MSRRRRLDVAVEEWPLVKPFAISRKVDFNAIVVVVRLQAGECRGWGESLPYAHFGETPRSVVVALEARREEIEQSCEVTVSELGLRGAAANALDCALVDLASKEGGVPAWQLLKEDEPGPLQTVMTITLDTPEKMAQEALKHSAFGVLKVKLGAPDGDVDRMRAIREARPDARLICDANEGWGVDALSAYVDPFVQLCVEMIEQPCARGSDDEGMLMNLDLPIALCADESCHVAGDVERLVGMYDIINIKLDKTGGIRGALELVRAAKAHEFEIMVGCMLGTSLAMAPAMLVGQHAKYVDLDGPLALAGDRVPEMTYRGGMISPACPALWG